MAEMVDIAKHVGAMSLAAKERLEQAMTGAGRVSDGPAFAEAARVRDELLAVA
jgi:hypothetical protein